MGADEITGSNETFCSEYALLSVVPLVRHQNCAFRRSRENHTLS